ncbi:fractalkine [Sminthopsis crassicaudata]|uniref:fractalkine n=1 Tax=Sminthopsis crassicaudata TaxID=9301 RepID=UPI003D683F10
MGSRLPAMLLRLMVLGHLTSLLAGQHFSMNKCTHECPPLRSTRQLQNRLLKNYKETEPSCHVQAIIFITIKNRTLCADPNEKWVREAVQYLNDVSAAAAAQKQAPGKETGGMFEKLTGENGPPTTQGPGGGSTGPATLRVPSAPVPTSAGPSPSPTPGVPEEEAALETSAGLPTSPLPEGSTSPVAGGSGPDPLLASQGPETSTVTPPGGSSDSGSPAAGRPSEETPALSHPREEGSGRLKDPSEPGEERDFSTENPIIGEEMSTVFTLTNPFSKLAADGHSPASLPASESPSSGWVGRTDLPPKAEALPHVTADPQRLELSITPMPDSPQAATRRQAFGLLAFLGFLFCLGVAMFAYQSLQSCPRRMAGEVVEGLRYIPRSCGSNSYVLVPV